MADITKIRLQNGDYDIKDEKARPVENVEKMKALKNLKAGTVIKTLGYYELNDGGNALYLIREKQESDVEDLGSIHFINDDLVAELITNKTSLNVKQFGAKGDNVNDDYQAIQKALFFASDNNMKLFIPNGNYLISQQLKTVTSESDVRYNQTFAIDGESSNVKINKFGTNTFTEVFDFEFVNNLSLTNLHSDQLSFTLITNKVYTKGFDYWSKYLKKKHFEFTNVFGTGEGCQKLICLPAPTKAGRYGDGRYDDYPLKIVSNSGYNAIEIENFGYNQEDDTSTPLDNSAIGIIDNVTNSTGVIFIDSKGDRSFERYVRSVEPVQSQVRPGTVWEISKSGHIAIGCSTDYNDEVAKTISCIKMRDNSPEIAFFDVNQDNRSTLLRMFKDDNGIKSFAVFIDGDVALKMVNEWRNNSKVVTGVDKLRIMVTDAGSNDLRYYIKNTDQSKDFEVVLSPDANGNLRFGNGTAAISERHRVQVVHASEKWFRPTLSSHWRDIGYMFFDTDLKKPIWWNGTNWVDASGNAV